MFVIFKTIKQDFVFNNLPLFEDDKHIILDFSILMILYNNMFDKKLSKAPPQF